MFDKQEALFCLFLTQLSYRDAQGVMSYYPDANFFDIDEVQGFSFVNNANELYIVFRATDSFKDWKRNFKIWKKKDKENDVKIHAGFYSAFISVWPEIWFTVHDYLALYPKKQIIITGHSFGGGLSHIIDFYLHKTFPIFTEVYSFGAPRVGNKDFSEIHEYLNYENIYRVINGNDIVTKVPPPWLFYKHSGQLIHVGEKNKWWKWSKKDHYPVDWKGNKNNYKDNIELEMK